MLHRGVPVCHGALCTPLKARLQQAFPLSYSSNAAAEAFRIFAECKIAHTGSYVIRECLYLFFPLVLMPLVAPFVAVVMDYLRSFRYTKLSGTEETSSQQLILSE